MASKLYTTEGERMMQLAWIELWASNLCLPPPNLTSTRSQLSFVSAEIITSIISVRGWAMKNNADWYVKTLEYINELVIYIYKPKAKQQTLGSQGIHGGVKATGLLRIWKPCSFYVHNMSVFVISWKMSSLDMWRGWRFNEKKMKLRVTVVLRFNSLTFGSSFARRNEDVHQPTSSVSNWLRSSNGFCSIN